MIPAINGTVKTFGAAFPFPSDSVTFSGETEVFMVLQERLSRLPDFSGLRFSEENEGAFLRALLCPDITPGGYHLNLSETCITIESADREGLANALTTLYWKIREDGGTLCSGEISDCPAKPYRGFLLDCSRHFFDVETVKSAIEHAALCKLNRMHWHLSDDQGYRIESRRFPELNSVSSWRTETDGTQYGGFYTWEQIREILCYARARGVEIMPEIDMPGHMTAIISAFPQYSCSGEGVEVALGGGIYPRILCAGRDEAIQFAKDLLDEVSALFPYQYFHIGGDEALKTEWKKCACCQKRIRSMQLADEEELQAWFTKQILDHLASRGKTVVCWNESLKSGRLDESAVVQYWDEEPDGYAPGAFNPGRRYIYSEHRELYLDYSAAMTPLRIVMNSKAHFADGRPFLQDELLGYEAALWSERIPDRAQLERQAFPRLFALAERAWGSGTEYADFLSRCEQATGCLSEDGVAHSTVAEADLSGEALQQALIAEWQPAVQRARQSGGEEHLHFLTFLIKNHVRELFSQEDIEKILRALSE